jgi:hypothetical protein
MMQGEQESYPVPSASSWDVRNPVFGTISDLLPAEAEESATFECPLCRRLIMYTGMLAWKYESALHVI